MINDLINNIDKIHTTELGIKRISNNLKISGDVLNYIKNKLLDRNIKVKKQGKNYYCEIDNIVITINAYNYCVITGHFTK